MAQLFDIKKVVVGPKNLEATVELAANAPLMTSEDLEGTTRVWQVMPELRDHVCLGDESGVFGDVMGNTELAHLLEHVTVELLARTDIAGDIACGQTTEVGERTYKITLKCVDDVLVVGALSSAAWLMQWAFSGGGDPRPDADAIAKGLVALVGSLPPVEKKPEVAVREPEPEDGEIAPETAAGDEPVSVTEGAAEPMEAAAPMAEPSPESATEPAAPSETARTDASNDRHVVDEAEVEAILAAAPAAAEPMTEPEQKDDQEPAREAEPFVESDQEVTVDPMSVSTELEADADAPETEVNAPEAEIDTPAAPEVAEPEPVSEVVVAEPVPTDAPVEPAVAAGPEEVTPVSGESAAAPQDDVPEPVTFDPAAAPSTPAPSEQTAAPVDEPPAAPVDDWGLGDVPRPRLVR
ncbi:MAG: hypothetical protein DBX94_07965 [Coriobacteriia bacterium]|uniref:cyanophycin synthetase family protein n=1 Tax=Paratractidigestivibacter sp. TaxID=2847316 RepID=UPI000D7972C5|nr:MAG: hypothetical protein DBX94_07965 [Coriobacteriia bacterium]